MHANNYPQIILDGSQLDLSQLVDVSRLKAKASLAMEARLRVQENADLLKIMARGDSPIYGVNTGFGVLSNRKIPSSDLDSLSRNLVLSHSVGVGPALEVDLVRAGILVRANTLAKGISGIRVKAINTLLDLLNKNVTPFIPSQGSLGSSGDLAPLAHLALIISAHPESEMKEYSGQAWFEGELLPGKEALSRAGIPPLKLGPKEGLALVNGAAFSAAGLGLAVFDACTLLDAAEKAAALSYEALQGISSALDSRIHKARQHPGQMQVARRLRQRTSGSTLIDSTDRVQDAYSLRCTPQVLGPVQEILSFVRETILREINAATDNPLIFTSEAVSGGNFHGQPISLAADYLKTAFCEVGSLSERRTYRMLSYNEQTGLPTMLVAEPSLAGLQSGLMLLQYTAASLVLENQTLATPDSIRSLPTSAGQEDHNANSFNAVRHLRKILDNLIHVIAIEFLTAAEALDIRADQFPDLKPAPLTGRLHQLIRQHIPRNLKDVPMSDNIRLAGDLIRTREIFRIT